MRAQLAGIRAQEAGVAVKMARIRACNMAMIFAIMPVASFITFAVVRCAALRCAASWAMQAAPSRLWGLHSLQIGADSAVAPGRQPLLREAPLMADPHTLGPCCSIPPRILRRLPRAACWERIDGCA